MTNKKPIGRRSDIVTQNIKDELMIYDLKINKAFCLNETSAFVWTVCDGKNSVAEITQQLSRKLKISVNEDYIWLTLNELN
ncbi:MAG: PqqD family protein, partial [Acidobacteriota bacterium]